MDVLTRCGWLWLPGLGAALTRATTWLPLFTLAVSIFTTRRCDTWAYAAATMRYSLLFSCHSEPYTTPILHPPHFRALLRTVDLDMTGSGGYRLFSCHAFTFLPLHHTATHPPPVPTIPTTTLGLCLEHCALTPARLYAAPHRLADAAHGPDTCAALLRTPRLALAPHLRCRAAVLTELMVHAAPAWPDSFH